MKENELSIDELLADASAFLEDDLPAETVTSQQEEAPAESPRSPGRKENAQKARKQKNSKESKKSGKIAVFFGILGKILAILVETALLLVIALYGVMFVLAKGPSPTARDLFVMSVRETSAMGWVANLYFTPEQIAEIENKKPLEEVVDIDTSLIQIPQQTQPAEGEAEVEQGPKKDAWGLIDEDGDGIIVEEVKGEGYSGYMMVVLDPSRVIVGSVPASYGARGYTVEQMVTHFDAVAATNAGGFLDPNGTGNGSIPDTMVVYDGKVYYENLGNNEGFVGFDSNHIMHVAHRITPKEIAEKDIRYGVSFGPVLILNGEPCDLPPSGVNPRTAVGQRSDGAILMLVIDGRQVISMGATHDDLIEILLEYGAVNACNLDGGSSSLMWYDGDYVNNCASVIGIRPVPTAIVVLKEGVKENG